MPFPNGKSNVLVEQPTYNGVLKAGEITKTSIVGIQRKFNGIDFHELERSFANDNIKCFYTIPRFSNPLGISYTNEEKKQILKLAEKYDVYIIEDDYLCDLELESNSFPMYYSDVSSRVVYLKSFSKILLPGLRIAAVVLPKLLRNTFYEYKNGMDLSTGVLSQGALEIYIKSGMFKANRKSIKKIYSNRMKALKEVASEIDLPNIKWHIPDTGFYACIEFLNEINIEGLIKACEKKNILISNMRKYYLRDYFSNDILKISVSKAEINNIKKATAEILKIINHF
ncbi:aminotransferase class I/II-fold pyridoxal phosphate-dependent enzyme [Clostridium hydrogenum]|uniref:aminotransferase class I/II-fold pyridoxal phosphate-dependent enzyme n=1 Tax=Clostridium hydrogenum TaxID=2855764 RepID=UPI001F4026C6|nr:PLP-dependent aminotransferase family protein [Clostridium hydrogenum]